MADRPVAEQLREAFLDGFRPEPGLAHRVVRKALESPRRRRRRWPLPVAAVALALALVLVVTVVLARGHLAASPAQTAAQAIAPLSVPEARPPDGALAYTRLGEQPPKVHLVDWSGGEMGTAFVLADGGSAMQVSPDASLAVAGGDPVAVFDRQGMVVARGGPFTMWSPDSRYGCGVQGGAQGLVLVLSTIAVGSIVQRSVPITLASATEKAVRVLACAVELGRVIVQAGSSVALLDPANGQALRIVPTATQLSASLDGRYLAESDKRGVRVVDMTTGAVVGHVPGVLPPEASAFSGDDSRLLVDSQDPYQGGWRDATWSVMDWRAGKVLAQAPGHAEQARSALGSPFLGIETETLTENDDQHGANPTPIGQDIVVVSGQGAATVVEHDIDWLV